MMLHLKRYALWYMYVHSLYITERMLTKNKLIRDVFTFAFDLLVCYILCLSRLAFCFAIFFFLKRFKLAWFVRAVFVMLCDSKRKTCLMKYSFEYMWQSVDVNPISLLNWTKSVMRVLVLWTFCSMLVFIDLCLTCCFFFFLNIHNLLALKDIAWCDR